VLRNEGSRLDSGELAKVGIIVGGGDLNEEDEGLRLAVELLLQDAGRFLNIALGGWKARVSGKISNSQGICPICSGIHDTSLWSTYGREQSAIAAGIVADPWWQNMRVSYHRKLFFLITRLRPKLPLYKSKRSGTMMSSLPLDKQLNRRGVSQTKKKKKGKEWWGRREEKNNNAAKKKKKKKAQGWSGSPDWV
jgi:hypothetical protein